MHTIAVDGNWAHPCFSSGMRMSLRVNDGKRSAQARDCGAGFLRGFFRHCKIPEVLLQRCSQVLG